MVVAGPGTGKTQILTLRIANILAKTDTPPDAILALTFTESAVAAMRKRLIGIIGSAAYRIKIFTFHGFCNEVIARYPDEFPRIIGSEPISEIDRISIIREILMENTFKFLKPFGNAFHYVGDIRQKISELKRENILPDALEEFLVKEEARFMAIDDRVYTDGPYKGAMKGKYQTEARKLERTRELLVAYREYEKKLREAFKFDFEDMIVEVVSALDKDRDLLLRLQEEHLYILADEHQDANASQNRLLELLSGFHTNPNIFVVGDEKQAIFRFQGASLENFLYFKNRFPEAKLVALTEGYRSGQKILDTAHKVITSQEGDAAQALRVPLVSRAGVTGESVEVRHFTNDELEKLWMATDIERKIGEGVTPHEIAILYRTNREAEEYARALNMKGLTVSVESDQNALSDPEIRKLVVVLRSLAYFGNDELLSTALHVPFLGITPLDFYKIARRARHEQCLFADVVRSREELKAAGVSEIDTVLSVYEKLSRWAVEEGSVLALFDEIVRDSGFLQSILGSKRSVDILEKLSGLVRDIEALAAGRPDYSMKDLVEHLRLLEEYRIPVRKEALLQPKSGSVRLMTAHKSKGLEFDYVYIPNAIDGNWGGRTSRESFIVPTGSVRGEDDDERRLFYVALTRARLSVAISHAQEVKGRKERLPARFIEEMDPALITHENTSGFESATKPADRFNEAPVIAAQLPDAAFLNQLFLEQGLSVTALNNYLTCPWRYFYSNLIRIPTTPGKHMLFGTGVHAALKQFFDGVAQGKKMKKSDLVESFNVACKRLPLAREDMAEVCERGAEMLAGWYDAWHKSWNTTVQTEYRISTMLPLASDPHALRLRGDLDKLEFADERHVAVVDYKTGGTQSRNEIQGKTKASTGDYWRQLVFYKLLLDLEGRYVFTAAELDFIQPDDKGKYRKERFEVTEADVEALRATIEKATREILDLSFWDTRCEDAECEYCALRELMH